MEIAGAAPEREIERALVKHVRDFLLELGVGFSFVGNQVRLEVEGDEYFIDLLFYHLRLRCFVVVELKNTAFKPEHAGQLNFYLSAVDDLLRHPDDKPTIGLLLCKSNKLLEYGIAGSWNESRRETSSEGWKNKLKSRGRCGQKSPATVGLG